MRLGLIVLTYCVIWTLAHAKRGIIVTTPGMWLRDSDPTICVSLHDMDITVLLRVEVDLSKGRSVTKSQNIFSDRVECFSIVLPRDDLPSKAKLIIDALSIFPPFMFYQERTLTLHDAPKINITIIETDKPVYKPGDEVKFRILTVNENLKPCVQHIPLIVTRNSEEFTVAQWWNISVAHQQGLASLSFELPSDAVLGSWQIIVTKADGHIASQTFTVEKYGSLLY